jgi:hypothetical protein
MPTLSSMISFLSSIPSAGTLRDRDRAHACIHPDFDSCFRDIDEVKNVAGDCAAHLFPFAPIACNRLLS